MCTRYITPDQAAIEHAWRIGQGNQPKWWAHEVFPRSQGPFLRLGGGDTLALVVGAWGLIPNWAKTPVLKYSTNNCRSEEAPVKPTFKDAWHRSQRCIIPALSFDEPCWETGRNVWWRFERADGLSWGLAGLWNTWTDKQSGEVVESYTMLTVNADGHPVMSRMHKPDPNLPPDEQDKRSVVSIESADMERWLHGNSAEVAALLKAPEADIILARPA